MNGKRSGTDSAPNQAMGTWIWVTLRIEIRMPLMAMTMKGKAKMTATHRWIRRAVQGFFLC